MFKKKENHNIPKDYDKSVKKTVKDDAANNAIIGSATGGGSNPNKTKLPNLSTIFNNKKVVGFVIIIFITIGVFAYLFLNSSINNSDDKQEENVEIVIPEIIENRTSEEILLEEYNNLAPELKSKTQNSDTKIRIEAYKDLAYLALNAQKYEEALLNAKKYEELEASYLSAELIGLVAYEKGDYQLSVKYYDVAMSRVPKEDDPNKDTLYNRYLAKKQQAEAKL